MPELPRRGLYAPAKSAELTAAPELTVVNTVVNKRVNTKVRKYPNTDARRTYMRNYMREHRQVKP